jgi:N-methylhydantoinase B
MRGERYFTPPWGLYGGQPAAAAQAWVERADGRVEEIPSKRVFTLHQGERLYVETPGGGGYGDALERDPSAVRQDVCDRRVSVRMARELYGVVLEEPGCTIDQQATQRLRATLRQQRGAITWVYDRGPLGKV